MDNKDDMFPIDELQRIFDQELDISDLIGELAPESNPSVDIIILNENIGDFWKHGYSVKTIVNKINSMLQDRSKKEGVQGRPFRAAKNLISCLTVLHHKMDLRLVMKLSLNAVRSAEYEAKRTAEKNKTKDGKIPDWHEYYELEVGSFGYEMSDNAKKNMIGLMSQEPRFLRDMTYAVKLAKYVSDLKPKPTEKHLAVDSSSTRGGSEGSGIEAVLVPGLISPETPILTEAEKAKIRSSKKPAIIPK